jgi:hypothetical protein
MNSDVTFVSLKEVAGLGFKLLEIHPNVDTGQFDTCQGADLIQKIGVDNLRLVFGQGEAGCRVLSFAKTSSWSGSF